jgi:hypothetical protein
MAGLRDFRFNPLRTHGRQTGLRKEHLQNCFAILQTRFHGLQAILRPAPCAHPQGLIFPKASAFTCII